MDRRERERCFNNEERRIPEGQAILENIALLFMNDRALEN